MDSSPSDDAPLAIAEFEIPEVLAPSSETAAAELPVARVLQNYVDIETRVSANPEGNRIVGLIGVVGERLVVGTYNSYDANGVGPEKLVLFDDAANIASSPVSSWMDIDCRDNCISWMSEIPASASDSFGGDTHVFGNGGGMSINTRCSEGPSFYHGAPGGLRVTSDVLLTTGRMAWEGARSSMATGDFVRPTPYVHNPFFSDWDSYNEATTAHYMAVMGYERYAYPSWQSGQRYDRGEVVEASDGQLYESLQDDNRGNDPSSDATAWSLSDVPNRSFYASGNAESRRQQLEDAYAKSPAPPHVVNDLWSQLSTARYGFIVPGTSTYLVLGKMAGRRFGGGYKELYTHLDGNVRSPGNSPLDALDTDAWYWAFDVADILNEAAPEASAVRPYDRGVFDSSRWLRNDGRSVLGDIGGAAFDASTGRLYVSYARVGPSTGVVVGVYDTGVGGER